MGSAFSDVVPPTLSGWPPDPTNVPPCPMCGTPMTAIAQFQVNLLGSRQIQSGLPAVEIADVLHVCPVYQCRVMRRFQAPA